MNIHCCELVLINDDQYYKDNITLLWSYIKNNDNVKTLSNCSYYRYNILPYNLINIVQIL